MDNFNQVGPLKGDYLDDCGAIADQLDSVSRSAVWVNFAALGARHGLLLVPRPAILGYGSEPQGLGGYDQTVRLSARRAWLINATRGAWIVVRLEGGGCEHGSAYAFASLNYHSADHVARKLGLQHAVDALAVAGFLNRIEVCRGADFTVDQLIRWEAQAYRAMCAESKTAVDPGQFHEATGCDEQLAVTLLKEV